MTDRAITGLQWDSSLLFRWQIPLSLHAGLERYLKHGIRPGGFLFAVLTNDLAAAFLNASDPDNEEAIGRIVRFLADEASANTWGSREKVTAWIEQKQAERADEARALQERAAAICKFSLRVTL